MPTLACSGNARRSNGVSLNGAFGSDFEAVYSQHVRFVWRVLWSMGVSDACMDDAVQDVFIVVHRRLPEFDGRYQIRSWLFAIARRVASVQRRNGRRTQDELPIEYQLRDEALTPAESAERSEALQVACKLLDQLDDDKRTVLVLTDIEGMTAPEIAEITGTQLATVYTRLRRARLQLNQALLKWWK